MNRKERILQAHVDMYETYLKKNADYGDSFSDTYKKFGGIAPVVRMEDKMNRIQNSILKMYENGFENYDDTITKFLVDDESLQDSLLDLANYAIMFAIELDMNLYGDSCEYEEDYSHSEDYKEFIKEIRERMEKINEL